MCMGVVPACMSLHHMCAVSSEARRGFRIDPLELELELVVSHQMDAGFPLNGQPVLLDIEPTLPPNPLNFLLISLQLIILMSR